MNLDLNKLRKEIDGITHIMLNKEQSDFKQFSYLKNNSISLFNILTEKNLQSSQIVKNNERAHRFINSLEKIKNNVSSEHQESVNIGQELVDEYVAHLKQ